MSPAKKHWLIRDPFSSSKLTLMSQPFCIPLLMVWLVWSFGTVTLCFRKSRTRRMLRFHRLDHLWWGNARGNTAITLDVFYTGCDASKEIDNQRRDLSKFVLPGNTKPWPWGYFSKTWRDFKPNPGLFRLKRCSCQVSTVGPHQSIILLSF